MSQLAIQIFADRATSEEGVKLLPYDDATGKPVVAPVGNLSWGIGFNLMKCGSVALFKVMISFLATSLDESLSDYSWYAQANAARQSVFLDVAFNGGLHEEIYGYPKMIHYASLGDWTNCAAQCTVARADLDKSRYEPLRKILLTGIIAP